MTVTAPHNYGLVTSVDQLKRLIDACYAVADRGGKIGYDIETGYYGADREKGAVDDAWGDQFISGFSVAPRENLARYVAVGHDNSTQNLDPQVAWALMKPMLEELPIIAHNARFESKNLRRLDEKDQGPSIELNVESDTMLEAYVLSEWRLFNLKSLVKEVFGHQMTKIEALFPNATAKQIKALRFNVLELNPEVVSYACEDAAWCLALHNKLGPRAKEQRGKILKLEHMISQVMLDVEKHGVMVDWEGLIEQRDLAEGYAARSAMAVKEAFGNAVGREMMTLNLNSPAQIKKLLYKELGWKTTRLTKGAGDEEKSKGKEMWELMSTDAIALEALSRDHAVVKQLLEYRETVNLQRRLEKWPLDYKRWSPDLRVRPNFQQTVVGSGRFAASDPAIQQLPKKWWWALDIEQTEPLEGQKNGHEYWKGNFRDFIVAGPGNYLLTYDYSQIELRVMAGESQEPGLLEAFNRGDDVHTLTAAMMLNKQPWEVDPEKERPLGKTMNFALLYGMGIKKLAESLGFGGDEDNGVARAKELYENYFKNFPSITSWMNRMKSLGTERQYIVTPFERKCTVWEFEDAALARQSNSAEKRKMANGMQSKAERLCVNAPIQGGAADYMKIAMIRATNMLKEKGWWMNGCTIIMNQHDSLTFEVSNDIDANELKALLEEQVVYAVENYPKIVADWELGQRWGSSAKWSEDYRAEFVDGQWGLVKGETVIMPPKPVEPEVSVLEKEDEDLTADDLEIMLDKGEPVELVGPPEQTDSQSSDPRTLVVELQVDAPKQEDMLAFVALLKERPGNNEVKLTTPNGDYIMMSYTTNMTQEDKGAISLAAGGAAVYYEAEEVEADDLLKGILL